jgi:hypothetical protein
MLKAGGDGSSCTDSNTSGSPKSTYSDRLMPQNTIEDENKEDFFGIRKEEEEDNGDELKEDKKKLEKDSKRFIFPTGNDEDLFAKARGQSMRRLNTEQKSQLRDDFDRQAMFRDFTEPDLLKTGYLIPLTCGHNGQFNLNEKTIYEIHLTNAGFI